MMSRAQRRARIMALLNKRQPDLTVLMDRVHKPHNLSAIIRTCDSVGIDKVHAVYPEDRLQECHHTASGSNRWVDVNTYPTVTEACQGLKSQGVQLLATHLSEVSVDYRDIDYTKPTCIIVGAELDGVSDETIACADQHIIIPMVGMVQSLNVSVATALVLYEAKSQREQAGCYDERRVALEDYAHKMVEWLHPTVAKYCRQQNIRYPHLDDDGEIDDEEWHQLRTL